MSNNILDNISDYFTPEFKNTLANNLDESNAGVSKAISAIIPTAVSAIAARANEGDNGANNIFNLCKQASVYYMKSPDVAQLNNDEVGSNLPHDIFGKNEQEIERHISAFSGVRTSSISSLILMALPVITGKFGEQAQKENVSPGGFSSLLSGYRGDISSTIQDGYVLPDLKGNFVAPKEDAKKIHEHVVLRNQENFVVPKWLPVMMIAILILVLVYFSTRT